MHYCMCRVRQNPRRYGFSPSLTSAELNKQLMEMCVRQVVVRQLRRPSLSVILAMVIDIWVSNSSIKKLAAAGVVTFNSENLTVEPLPEAHHMSRHMIRLDSMRVLMKLSRHCSIHNVRLLLLTSVYYVWVCGSVYM